MKNEIYLTDKQLAQYFDVGRATIWRWISSNSFPSPRKLSPGCTRWKLSEIREWETGLQKVERGVVA
jgi:predicted DNA-binding transcriptional regulator AlpA